MIFKIILILLALIAAIVLGLFLFARYLNIQAKRRRNAWLATHPQTPLTEEKKRLLVFGAILFSYRREEVLSIVPDVDLKIYAEGMKSQWGVENTEDAMETLNALLALERTTEFDELISQNTDNRKLEYLREKIADGLDIAPDRVRQVNSTYAWDICRLVALSKWCYWNDYISEEYMWRFMQQGAAKAACMGENWQDYVISFLLGRTIQGFGLDDIKDCCVELFNENKSYRDGNLFTCYSFK